MPPFPFPRRSPLPFAPARAARPRGTPVWRGAVWGGPVWVAPVWIACVAGLLAASPVLAQSRPSASSAPARTLPAEGTAINPARAKDLSGDTITPMTGVPTPSALAVPAVPSALLTPDATPPVAPTPDPDGVTAAPVTPVRPRAVSKVAAGGAPARADHYVVSFVSGSSAADQVDAGLLAGIATRLGGDPSLRLEIRAYAPLPGPEREAAARRLSLLRAIALRERLLRLGVTQDRMIVYAMGAAATAGADFDHADLKFVP